jgi:glycerol-3-phosphate dehydrogenase subunit B
MNAPTRHFTSELAVIGTGLAGFAAAVFAANRGIATAIVGHSGAVAYTTGYFDLLGRLEGAAGGVADPWQALAMLRTAQPQHPLSRLDPADIRRGLDEFTAFLGANGIGYTAPGERNLTALTPIGTLKQTLCVPLTMAAATQALAEATPCVIVDFEGLKGFSGRELVANLGPRWPGLSTQRIAFPGLAGGELYPEVMARALEVPATREKLAAALRAVAGPARIIGLPAILGMHRPDDVHAQLQRLTATPIFEIPTMPPAVPGVRLRELFEQALPGKGVRLIPQHKVSALGLDDQGATLELTDAFGPVRLRAGAVILATGRFLSGGLRARPDGVVEHLLDLPLAQPASRADWYRERYTDARGHPLHRAGIEVDAAMRPLARDGRPHHPRLFAAGVILAHQDWIRSRSGAGIAVATAWRAVAAAEAWLQQAPASGESIATSSRPA